MMPEIYECANCQRLVELDVHGRCELCGSLAVLSTEKIPKAGEGVPELMADAPLMAWEYRPTNHLDKAATAALLLGAQGKG